MAKKYKAKKPAAKKPKVKVKAKRKVHRAKLIQEVVPLVELTTRFKGRPVTILRDAAPGDSFYLEGQHQVIVQFVDDKKSQIAFPVQLTSP